MNGQWVGIRGEQRGLQKEEVFGYQVRVKLQKEETQGSREVVGLGFTGKGFGS